MSIIACILLRNLIIINMIELEQFNILKRIATGRNKVREAFPREEFIAIFIGNIVTTKLALERGEPLRLSRKRARFLRRLEKIHFNGEDLRQLDQLLTLVRGPWNSDTIAQMVALENKMEDEGLFHDFQSVT
jgi:hypothetical protein